MLYHHIFLIAYTFKTLQRVCKLESWDHDFVELGPCSPDPEYEYDSDDASCRNRYDFCVHCDIPIFGSGYE